VEALFEKKSGIIGGKRRGAGLRGRGQGRARWEKKSTNQMGPIHLRKGGTTPCKRKDWLTMSQSPYHLRGPHEDGRSKKLGGWSKPGSAAVSTIRSEQGPP